MSEHDLQASLFNWVAYNKGKIPELGNFFAIPNGGQRHPAVASKLKKEGVMPGVFDTFLAIPTKNSHGLFLELKWGKGKLSDNQKIFKSKVECWGYHAYVAYSIEEAQHLLLRHIEQNQEGL